MELAEPSEERRPRSEAETMTMGTPTPKDESPANLRSGRASEAAEGNAAA